MSQCYFLGFIPSHCWHYLGSKEKVEKHGKFEILSRFQVYECCNCPTQDWRCQTDIGYDY